MYKQSEQWIRLSLPLRRYHYDEEIKLYYLRARYYNRDTGVFLSLDSVRGDTMNGYNYANNNPVMNVDLDGEYSVRTDYIANFINAIITALPFVGVLISKARLLGKL